ncbi:MAG: hypothetical protein WD114_01490 [Phycisphaerales bacterium]
MSMENEHNNTTDIRGDGIYDLPLPGDDRDRLISRIADGMADAGDWARLRTAVGEDPAIWTDLIETQRQQRSLCAELTHAVSAADRVPLPPGIDHNGIADDHPTRLRLDMVSRWGGWAAAIALVLVWFVGNPPASGPGDPTEIQQAGLLRGFTPLKEARSDEAFDQYLSAGRRSGTVVGEMPEQIVIETRPMADGTIEVLLLRQVIERQVIDRAYRQMHDETGNAFAVPVRLEPTERMAF